MMPSVGEPPAPTALQKVMETCYKAEMGNTTLRPHIRRSTTESYMSVPDLAEFARGQSYAVDFPLFLLFSIQ
jgi:hypothetical protein